MDLTRNGNSTKILSSKSNMHLTDLQRRGSKLTFPSGIPKRSEPLNVPTGAARCLQTSTYSTTTPDSRVNSLLKPLITKLKETPQGMPRPKKLSCRKRGKTSGWKCTISSESNPSKKTCPCITPSMFQYEILNIYANRFSKLIFYILNGIVKIQKFYF